MSGGSGWGAGKIFIQYLLRRWPWLVWFGIQRPEREDAYERKITASTDAECKDE